MPTLTATAACLDLPASQHALRQLDHCARQMRTTYAGAVPEPARLEFVAHYVQWSMFRWFAEQSLRRLVAANDPAAGGAAEA
jgi:hypothetical protein